MNEITIRRGTEGPRHDPYSFTEVTIRKELGFVTYHGGLVEWTEWRLESERTGTRMNGEPEASRKFEVMTGLTPQQAEKTYWHLRTKRINQHLRSCQAEIESMSGYPGETFQVCSKCNEILESNFNPKAIE